MWYTAADLVTSKLLTGRAPRLRRAVRLVPHGVQDGLRGVKFARQVAINPEQDPFVAMIEHRLQLADTPENAGLRLALKITANGGSYGMYAELNAQELPGDQMQSVNVRGRHDQPWKKLTSRPEQPGKYCFPPIAATITGAARLMLAMLERCVTDQGGVWAFCDTDSMAIVSTPDGGLVACPGGPDLDEQGPEAVKSLSADEVAGILERFQQLNPYQADVRLLKVEAEEVMAYSISSKRYCLYTTDEHGQRHVVPGKFSEHGLGHLLNPLDPDNLTDHGGKKAWVAEIWHHILNNMNEPDWFRHLAVSRFTATNPRLMAAFETRDEPKAIKGGQHDDGKTYRDQIKPFGFILAAHLPPGTPGDPRLVAPYHADPRTWTELIWDNLHANHDDLPSGTPWKLLSGSDSLGDVAPAAHVESFWITRSLADVLR